MLDEPFEKIEQRVIIHCLHCACKKDVAMEAYAFPGLDEKTYRKIAKELATKIIELAWNRRYCDGQL